MTAKELSDRLHVNKSYVSLLESDSRSPSVDVLQKLAEALRVPLGFLVDGATGKTQTVEGQALRGVMEEFDALERKLRRVIEEIPGRSKTSRTLK